MTPSVPMTATSIVLADSLPMRALLAVLLLGVSTTSVWADLPQSWSFAVYKDGGLLLVNTPGSPSVSDDWSSTEGSEVNRAISFNGSGFAQVTSSSLTLDSRCSYSHNQIQGPWPDWFKQTTSRVVASITFASPVVFRGTRQHAMSQSALRMFSSATSGVSGVPVLTSSGTAGGAFDSISVPFSGLRASVDLDLYSNVAGQTWFSSADPESRLGAANSNATASVEWDENTVITPFSAANFPRASPGFPGYDLVTATAPGSCEAPVSFSVQTYRGQPANATISFNPLSGGTLPPGRHNVTCTVNYAWGPVDTFGFVATVHATPGPCPEDNMMVANGSNTLVSLKHPFLCGVTSRGLTARDASGAVIFSTANSAEEVQVAFPVGINTVTMSGERNDGLGSYSCAFTVTVLAALGAPQDFPNDTDGDGAADWEELRARTNPFDSRDRLKLEAMNLAGALKLQWSAKAGVRYQLEQGALDGQPWQPLGSVISTTNDGPHEVDLPMVGPSGFYRVGVIIP